MEKTVRILQQLAFQERNYTDRNGQNQTFASMGFVLTDGVDTFYAEMQGDMARSNRDIRPEPDLLHQVQTQIAVREYQDKDGRQHFSNEVRIIKMV